MLTREPDHIIFIEPKFHTPPYRSMLAPQLLRYGMKAREDRPGLAPPALLDHMLGEYLRPIKWGFKEVQCSEHRRVHEVFRPKHIVVNVRDIFGIALSFLEKHRRQGNQDRFPPAWVREYCLRESRGMVAFCEDLSRRGHAFTVVRYEDFTGDAGYRDALEKSLSWKFGTGADRFLAGFDREFEVSRHQGRAFREPTIAERDLPPDLVDLAREIETRCAGYQRFFGYCPAKGAAPEPRLK
jgi:hypothetical protein